MVLNCEFVILAGGGQVRSLVFFANLIKSCRMWSDISPLFHYRCQLIEKHSSVLPVISLRSKDLIPEDMNMNGVYVTFVSALRVSI